PAPRTSRARATTAAKAAATGAAATAVAIAAGAAEVSPQIIQLNQLPIIGLREASRRSTVAGSRCAAPLAPPPPRRAQARRCGTRRCAAQTVLACFRACTRRESAPRFRKRGRAPTAIDYLLNVPGK